jgi:protein-S-isoprenylcysteine O-methyltransferase Ste14
MSQTTPYPSARERNAVPAGASVGELMSHVTSDLSLLVRQEVALAKAEIREEAAKAGKGAGLLGAAGYASHMIVLFGTFALVFGLGNWVGLGWACLIVTLLWAAAGVLLAVKGKRTLSAVHPKPERTIETLKEDAQWARHPRS